MGFNEAQTKAICHKNGPAMVLAGPGSGKTLVITRRVEYLIKKYGVRPEQILVITFTKAAAKEMRERFARITKEDRFPVTFGTFHGIYYGILKWAYRMNASNIFSEEEKMMLLREVIAGMELEIEDEKEFLQGIASEIGQIKNNRLSLEEYESSNCSDQMFCQIYEEYERRRKLLKKIDFDDMLVLCYELFQKRPDILQMWQKKFQYILIDEFQDINQVQYDVIRMLALPENNLFIVGDDDQSIYRFRGARPEIMLGFSKDYPNAKSIILDVNYRSTKAVVSAARRVIERNKNRYQKEIITVNEQGDNVHIQEVRHPVEESHYVREQIAKAVAAGTEPSQIAVLYRTNTEPRALVETFMEYHIPFQMKEHLPNLYEHFIGRDFQSYMRMALGGRDRGDFLMIMNRPNRYIGRDSVDRGEISFENLRKYYMEKDWMVDRIDQLEVDLKVISRMTPYAAIQYIRKSVGYDLFLNEYAIKRKMKLEDLQELIREMEERAKEFKTIEEWFDHIEKYTEELRMQAVTRTENRNAVSLMTFHAAKGLEYDTVFIIGANEDVTPYKKAELPEEMEEERRMFYVAMTRAKKHLTISYVREKNGKAMEQSRFLGELFQNRPTR
ncbi:DNA helicase-2/ATP-dependent DNA helicase PcrA [Faecalimonas umbilicata]|uniref:DNA 3'-5' helicase n=1 Tax=Faecalimonas umbilicata TaxID=1912855 RepID=A0A4R3J8H5_9FIRM|nr:ATP-dependent helicase [Faecalimonas umbilicata]TCS62249.1 DNA helicase-2/ATP-dependent DNA helicase PcrA [Faecalimonas umbilicata]GBU06484.1 DNA helicase [Faecalimonas umbilicata]